MQGGFGVAPGDSANGQVGVVLAQCLVQCGLEMRLVSAVCCSVCVV